MLQKIQWNLKTDGLDGCTGRQKVVQARNGRDFREGKNEWSAHNLEYLKLMSLRHFNSSSSTSSLFARCVPLCLPHTFVFCYSFHYIIILHNKMRVNCTIELSKCQSERTKKNENIINWAAQTIGKHRGQKLGQNKIKTTHSLLLLFIVQCQHFFGSFFFFNSLLLNFSFSPVCPFFLLLRFTF